VADTLTRFSSKVELKSRLREMAQELEHLPSKFEALNSNPSTTKKEKKKKLKILSNQ
jgi:hypothetical protein